MDLKELITEMNHNSETICRYLFPQGILSAGEYCVGDISGSAGKSLKINIEKGVWKDFADNEKGGDLFDLWKSVNSADTITSIKQIKDFLRIYEVEQPFKKQYQKPKPIEKPIQKTVMNYLQGERMIPERSILDYKVSGDKNMFFPYYKNGEQVNYKIRSFDKKMQVAKNAEPCLFGWQVIEDNDRSVVICEGEIDALSWYAYGYKALSVPFGAGVGEKNKWIENDWEELERFDTIYVSMDMDKPGKEASMDIITRLGIHRCREIKLPKNDINECLKDGFLEREIDAIIKESKYIPHESLLSFADSWEDMEKELFTEGDKYYSPGFHDDFKNVHFYDGEMSVWAGVNGHGKTSLMMQLALDLVYNNYRVCIASLEQRWVKYLKKIIWQVLETKYVKKEDVQKVYDWLGDRVYIYNKIGNVNPDDMLKAFNYARKRYNVNHFIIDSLSKLGFAEDDYNGQKKIVDDLCNFSIQNRVHSHLVHHVRKGAKERSSQDKFDIKGTGAITDMAFNVFMVVRNKEPESGESQAVILVKKQREHGWEGSIPLNYNVNCDKFYNGKMFNYKDRM